MRFVFMLLSALSIGLQVIGAEKNGSHRKEQHHVSDVADRVLDVVGPSPQTWNLKNLNTGGSATIKTCVKTPVLQNIEVPDGQVYFLSDTTSSMGDYLKFGVIRVFSAYSEYYSRCYPGTVELAVGEYRDVGDSFVYRLNQGFTTSNDDVLKAFNNWSTKGGGGKEANLYALKKAAEDEQGKVWNSTKFHRMYWAGDAAGNDPSVEGVTLLNAIDALKAKKIEAYPFDFRALNATGQAQAIEDATYLPPSPSPDKPSTSSIATGMGNMYIPFPNTSKSVDKSIDTNVAVMANSVAPKVYVVPRITCSPGLNLTFSPFSVTGRANDTLCMDEVLTMTGCVGEGKCTVDFYEKCSDSLLGSQEVSVTCSSAELVSFRLWTASYPEAPTLIKDGDEICLPRSRISIDVNYGGSAASDPIRSVRLTHVVDGFWKSSHTERVAPYFLYGNRKEKISWRNPVLGKNKITVKVNRDGPMTEINFTFKSCP